MMMVNSTPLWIKPNKGVILYVRCSRSFAGPVVGAVGNIGLGALPDLGSKKIGKTAPLS